MPSLRRTECARPTECAVNGQIDVALLTLRLPRVDAPKSPTCGSIGRLWSFAIFTFFFALLVLLILGGVIVALVEGALPALRAFGFCFLFTEVWNPVTEKFGALAPIYGTLVTSAIAMLVGIPVASGSRCSSPRSARSG